MNETDPSSEIELTEPQSHQNAIAKTPESGTLPSVQSADPAFVTREAANIARELRQLAHRVESFKIGFAR